MQSLQAFNVRQWIDANRAQLRPPVGNKRVFRDGDFIIMVVGGPNARKDFHVDPGEEFFYQLEGEMVLRTMQAGSAVEVPIRAGEVLLLPPGVPHSPQRPAGTVGLVVEVPKFARGTHHLRWYCRECGHVLHDSAFEPVDLGKQIKAMLAEFNGTAELHKCKKCGAEFKV